MKKITIILLAIFILAACLLPNSADAAKKAGGGKKASISKEDMEALTTSVDEYTRKVYANSLFSPKDIEKIIEIKLKLDDAMLATPNPEFAPLYFKIGNIYRAREYKEEAIDCYQTIMENFADTAFYPKARKMLETMGVKVQENRLNLPGDSTSMDDELVPAAV